MLYAGIDIHKAVFQAVVLDPDSGELSECRFEPSRERLADWAMQWQGRLAAVAIEATTGWRWVVRVLEQHGVEVHLVDPGRASALRGRRRQPKTDRLDARWLALLLARELLSECEACCRRRGSSGCATGHDCGRRSPVIGPAGRSGCMRCSRTRAGPARAGGSSPRRAVAGSRRSSSTRTYERRST
jgi:Transposase